MTAVTDSLEESLSVSDDEHNEQAVLGGVMVATVFAVVVAGSLFQPSAAAVAAVVMLPILIFASLRTDLGEHTSYTGIARQR